MQSVTKIGRTHGNLKILFIVPIFYALDLLTITWYSTIPIPIPIYCSSWHDGVDSARFGNHGIINFTNKSHLQEKPSWLDATNGPNFKKKKPKSTFHYKNAILI